MLTRIGSAPDPQASHAMLQTTAAHHIAPYATGEFDVRDYLAPAARPYYDPQATYYATAWVAPRTNPGEMLIWLVPAIPTVGIEYAARLVGDAGAQHSVAAAVLIGGFAVVLEALAGRAFLAEEEWANKSGVVFGGLGVLAGVIDVIVWSASLAPALLAGAVGLSASYAAFTAWRARRVARKAEMRHEAGMNFDTNNKELEAERLRTERDKFGEVMKYRTWIAAGAEILASCQQREAQFEARHPDLYPQRTRVVDADGRALPGPAPIRQIATAGHPWADQVPGVGDPLVQDTTGGAA